MSSPTPPETPSTAPLAPHPVLPGHYRSAEERVRYIRPLFDESAPYYDRINAWMSLATGTRYRREALVRAGLAPGQRVLDLACGTGVLARHALDLVGPAGRVLALDPSLPMLAEARGRGVTRLAAGIAEALPLRSESVDFISMGYALRHVADLRRAFAELRRVLRPGGRLLILEMVPPRAPLPRALSRLYLKYLVPGLTTLVTGSRRARRLMDYYWETVDQCVPPEVVMEALRDAGFAGVHRTVQFGLLTEYQGVRDATAESSPS